MRNVNMRGRFHVFLLASVLASTVSALTEAGETSGWRGDGSGRYPDANPPLNWGRIAASVKELSAQSHKPKEGSAPTAQAAIPDGVIRQWLVLGPLPINDETEIADILPGAEALSPDAGERVKKNAWQAVTLETSCLDLCSTLNVAPDKTGLAAYAHTYLYSPSGQPIAWNLLFQGQGTNRVWLNGKPVYVSSTNIDLAPGIRLVLPLQKGWNRLLVLNAKTLAARKSWWFAGSLYGEKTTEYQSHGIVWSTPMPAPGSSAPVIMGDRLFVTTETGSVVCIDKANGKLLWIRSLTYYDFATADERNTHPERFAELDPLAKQLQQIDQIDLVMPWKVPALEKDWRSSVEGKIFKAMAQVSRDKRSPLHECEAGLTAHAPITDGKYVYAVFGSGICVCYDRDGNRKWMRLLNHDRVEHGYTTSPLLVDGKLIIYFNNFTILDAATGKTILERPHFLAPGTSLNWYTNFHATGVLLPAGGAKVLYFLNGEFVRLSDGKTLTLDEKKLAVLKPVNYTQHDANRVAAPVVENGVAYKIQNNKGGVVMFKLPPLQGDKVDPEIIREIPFGTPKFPYYYEPFYCASPLLHEGLLYCLNSFGTMTVLDVERGEVVYQRQLDLEVFMPYSGNLLLKGGAQSSPTLAGKYIYIFGNQGATLILEPGRTFKQVAKLRLENVAGVRAVHQEATMTNPVFEGRRMYYHAEASLYCVGKTE
jgi:outer membrane protein assembly factor BamB